MVSVLGLARTGLIFTRIQEGAQLGGLTQTQPGQSRVFHTVCHRAGFQWGGGGTAGTHSRLGSAGASPVQENSSVLRTLFCGFVLCNPLFCIVVVPVPFVCYSVKLPLSRPTGFCLFSFHSPPHPGRGRGGRVALLMPAAAETRTVSQGN